MDRKRKRRGSESFSGLNGQLCEKCSSIFATVENLRKLATWPGFKHHDEIALREHARDGCTLCALFYEKLKPKDQNEKNVGSLFLSPLAHHGEAALSTNAKSRYPGVIMNTGCLFGRFENGDSQYTFDIVWLKERTKLEFPIAPLSYHLNSETVVAEIQKRLKICQERHACSNTSLPYLPTRVIDVGSTTGKRSPHLHISQEYEKGCYAALSYCWGGPQRVTTTSDNIHSFTKTLPINTVPKTIQDALKVTQKLGLRYLWIDAFCILQDSDHDKAKEIDAMGTIYQNATITIAATGARSVKNGFLQNVTRQHSASLAFQLPKKCVANVAIVENLPRWDKGPLSTRAWACQEFYLSARVLLYGLNGDLRWHCQRDKLEPLFGKNPVIETKTTRRLKKGKHAASWERKLAYREKKRLHSTLTHDRPTDLRMSQFTPWHRFIEDFSGRNITDPEDRLPALAGIARYMSDSIQDDYLAGTWRSELIHHISWSLYYHKDRHFQRCLTAPSWSWASVNRPVKFHRIREIAQVESCDIVPIDEEAPFGKVREGVLKLRAPVLKLGKECDRFLSWGKSEFRVDMDDAYAIKPDPSEVDFVRLGLSFVPGADVPGTKLVKRFFGIIVINPGDGRYKRIGSFDHIDRDDLLESPEGFLESRNSLEPWSAAWKKAEVKVITIV